MRRDSCTNLNSVQSSGKLSMMKSLFTMDTQGQQQKVSLNQRDC